MITTKIKIKEHLAEYLRGKYNNCAPGPVNLPAGSDLYIVVWDLMAKRPANAGIDTGNLELALPSRAVGKKPEYYNYLSARSVKIIEKLIEGTMYAEIHHNLRVNKRAGLKYIETIHYFMREYGITAISEDAFQKEFYRLRRNEFNRQKRMTILAKKHS